MTCKIIQVNLNHCRKAQDCLVQEMAQTDCGLGILSEPHNARESPKMAVSQDGLAAITWRDAANSSSMVPFSKGLGFIAVKWGPIAVVSVYLSPSLGPGRYAGRLEVVGRQLRKLSPGPIIVAGDFNTKSGAWRSPRQDRRGSMVLDWAADPWSQHNKQ